MSERLKKISKLIDSRPMREAYIGAKLKVLIPSQIKALRLKSQTPRQSDLATIANMKQSRISAMEMPGAVNFNLETLVRVASALKVGLVVKFVPFSEMLRWENGFSQDTFEVLTIDKDLEFLGEPAAPFSLAATATTSLGLPGEEVSPIPQEVDTQISPLVSAVSSPIQGFPEFLNCTQAI